MAEAAEQVGAQLAEALGGVTARARSIDGVRVELEAPADAGLALGCHVVVETPDARLLVQVDELGADDRDGPEVSVAIAPALLSGVAPVLAEGGGAQARVRLRRGGVRGAGAVLGALADGGLVAAPGHAFERAPLAIAPAEAVAAARRCRGAMLDIGPDRREPGLRALVRATGFARHTFLCGQSGSGKTFSLGVLLERLVLETTLRIAVIDPNGDHVHLGRARTVEQSAPTWGGEPPADLAARLEAYAAAAAGIHVARAAGGELPLRMRFGNLPTPVQAGLLRLDPLADRAEYRAFARTAAELGIGYRLVDLLERLRGDDEPAARELLLRIENLAIAEWSLWARDDERPIAQALAGGFRGLVLDISGFPGEDEALAAVLAVLTSAWSTREARVPILLVIDEAHNVCPAAPDSPLRAAATDLVVRIAGEGRKYGLHLLLATQRPDKLHPNVLSQCDNLVLMRMNSLADVADIERTFSFVPTALLRQAPGLVQGETLLAGPIVGRPLLGRFAGRLSPEGGSDVPTDWARQG